MKLGAGQDRPSGGSSRSIEDKSRLVLGDERMNIAQYELHYGAEKKASKSETATHIVLDYGTGKTYIPKKLLEE